MSGYAFYGIIRVTIQNNLCNSPEFRKRNSVVKDNVSEDRQTHRHLIDNAAKRKSDQRGTGGEI